MNNQVQPVVPVNGPLELKELTTVLIKHYGIHSGSYNLLIEFNIGVGAVGPSPDKTAPGAIVGISKIGLSEAGEDGPTTVNAAEVNPKIVGRREKASSKPVATKKTKVKK